MPRLGKDRTKAHIIEKDLYAFYKKTTKEPLPYAEWKKIIKNYNRRIVDHILEGKSFYWGESLSYIKIEEHKRVYKLDAKGNPILPIDWVQTRKLNMRDENGKLILVYITDQPYWYKTKWVNVFKSLKLSLQFYKFFPCKEFRLRISKRIKEDPFVVNNFRMA